MRSTRARLASMESCCHICRWVQQSLSLFSKFSPLAFVQFCSIISGVRNVRHATCGISLDDASTEVIFVHTTRWVMMTLWKVLSVIRLAHQGRQYCLITGFAYLYSQKFGNFFTSSSIYFTFGNALDILSIFIQI